MFFDEQDYGAEVVPACRAGTSCDSCVEVADASWIVYAWPSVALLVWRFLRKKQKHRESRDFQQYQLLLSRTEIA
jgi:hypothetical protein